MDTSNVAWTNRCIEERHWPDEMDPYRGLINAPFDANWPEESINPGWPFTLLPTSHTSLPLAPIRPSFCHVRPRKSTWTQVSSVQEKRWRTAWHRHSSDKGISSIRCLLWWMALSWLQNQMDHSMCHSCGRMLMWLFFPLFLTLNLIFIIRPLSSLRSPDLLEVLNAPPDPTFHCLCPSHISMCLCLVVRCNQCFSWIEMSRAPLKVWHSGMPTEQICPDPGFLLCNFPLNDHNHSRRAACKCAVHSVISHPQVSAGLWSTSYIRKHISPCWCMKIRSVKKGRNTIGNVPIKDLQSWAIAAF